MKDAVTTIPGIEAIRTKFLCLLATRQSDIAGHALGAFAASSATEAQSELVAARDILHKISGTAGSLGFPSLGGAARDCEEAIIDALEPDGRINLTALVERLDAFVDMCHAVLAANGR